MVFLELTSLSVQSLMRMFTELSIEKISYLNHDAIAHCCPYINTDWSVKMMSYTPEFYHALSLR